MGEKITLQEFFDAKTTSLGIVCHSREQASKLCQEFNKLGKTWYDGDSYLDFLGWYKTCERMIYTNGGQYSTTEGCCEELYEFEDVIFKPESNPNFVKKKLRDLTVEEYTRYYDTCCWMSGFLKDVDDNPHLESCWIFHKDLYSDKFLNMEIEIKKPKLSELEKDILKNFDGIEVYNYLARNEYGYLYLFNKRPDRFSDIWVNGDGDDVKNKELPYSNLFQSIQWNDEPFLIKELLD